MSEEHEEHTESAAAHPWRSPRTWPWSQIFILFFAIGLCFSGLNLVLKLFGSGVPESVQGRVGLSQLGALLGWLIALARAPRNPQQAAPLVPWLRTINLSLFGVYFLLILLASLIPAIHAGRSAARITDETSPSPAPQEWRRVQSRSGLHTVVLPRNWQPVVGSDGDVWEILQVRNSQDVWCCFSSESRADFTFDSIEDYAELVQSQLSQELQEFHVLKKSISLVPGSHSVEYEAAAVIEKVRLIFLMRFVETPEHFLQLRIWGSPTAVQKHEAELRMILSGGP
ncbi:hypothetical protein SH661x_002876 [Planctomicrobium sp. SH661]|uniref:hypothetical protein n=1 Tax=Planctomicrobium sp. SH661 TaxID=3448124 RepID=UPI003F5B27F6